VIEPRTQHTDAARETLAQRFVADALSLRSFACRQTIDVSQADR
jgi:hypothetical protein